MHGSEGAGTQQCVPATRLITGAANRSAITTLVERSSGYLLLVHLPGTHTADVTRAALIPALSGLPTTLRRSLAWDRGTEMAEHLQVTAATGMGIYFCDPHSPWQRGPTCQGELRPAGSCASNSPKEPTCPSTPSSDSPRSSSS